MPDGSSQGRDRKAAPRLAPAIRAVRLIFLMIGILFAAWVPMVPVLKARLDLGDSQLGLVLLALGTGAMTAMPLTGRLIARCGSRRVIGVAGLVAASLPPLLARAPDMPALAILLFLFGAFCGAVDIAMNAQAVAIEGWAARPLMSSIHGIYSTGGLAGAVLMSLLLKLSGSVLLCGGVAAALALAIVATQTRDLLPAALDAGPARPTSAEAETPVRRRRFSPMVLLLGALCFVAFLSEGAVLDWSAVLLRFSRGWSEAAAGLGYAAFSVAMAAIRLGGDRVVSHLGPRATARIGAALAACGLLVAALAPSGLASLAGFVLIGIGAANIVPVLIASTGRLPDRPASAALPLVTMIGYAGILAGPALIGFAARLTSLPAALVMVAALMAGVSLLAGRLPGSERTGLEAGGPPGR